MAGIFDVRTGLSAQPHTYCAVDANPAADDVHACVGDETPTTNVGWSRYARDSQEVLNIFIY